VIRRLFANLGAGLVIAACGAVAAVLGWRMGRPHVQPAPAASVFLASARSMQAATSYDFTGRVTIGLEVLNVTGTFSAPDSLQERLQLVGGPPIERVSVGAVTYQQGPGGWQRTGSAATLADPRAVFAALTGAGAVNRQGQEYSFDLTGPEVTALVSGATTATVATGTALIEGGRVQSLAYRSAAGAGTTATFTFSSIDAATPVTAPPSAR
jgi:hypothetical protein